MSSLRNAALVLLLQAIRRKRIYESQAGLLKGIAQMRRDGPAQPSSKMARRVKIRHRLIDGCIVYTLSPREQPSDRYRVLYLHGGAYVRPITAQHWRLLQQLVEQTGSVITVPLYPLAPEASGGQALAFVRRLYQELINEAPSKSLTLMGDSAGAGLTLALALATRDEGVDRASQLVLLTPWVDLSMRHPAIDMDEARDPMLAKAGLLEAGRLYAGVLPLSDPLVSPLHGDFTGLPRMTVFIGTRDILSHDAVLFVRKAINQGCTVDAKIGQDMIHAWPLLPIPEGRHARSEIANLLAVTPLP